MKAGAAWPKVGPDASYEERARAGLVKGVKGSVERWFDPIENEALRPTGESKQGVKFTQHPLIVLREEPELWHLVQELLDCPPDDGVRYDRSNRSNFEFEVIHTWAAARARRVERELKGATRARDRSGQDAPQRRRKNPG